jgi:uncharacterized protein YdhG (YjbR/CyaY superfamily)
MKTTAATPGQYIEQLPAEQQAVMKKLRACIRRNLPKGFRESVRHNMICYMASHAPVLDGYRYKDPSTIPLIMLASQKYYYSMHHMGLYGNPKLLEWFRKEYTRQTSRKLNMGKGCVRFKKPEDIPYGLIAELAKKITPRIWLELYVNNFVRRTGLTR